MLFIPLSFQGVPYCSRSNDLGDSPPKVMLSKGGGSICTVPIV